MHFISNGDFLFPFTWPLYYMQHVYTWSFQKGAANPDGVIRLPGRLIDILVFAMTGNVGFGYFYLISCMAIVFVSFWAFARYFLQIKKLSVQLIGALFFTLNPIFLGNLAKVGLVLAAAMLPLCFIVLQRAFDRHKFRYFLLWVLLLNISLLHPYTFIVNAVASLGYFAFRTWRDRRFVFGNLPKFVLVGMVALLFNAYFMLPQASMGTLNKDVLTSTIQSEPTDYTALVDVSNTGDLFTGLAMSKNVLKDFEFYDAKYISLYFLGTFMFYVILLAAYVRIEKRVDLADRRRFGLLLSLFLILVLLATVKFLHIDEFIKFMIQMPGGWAFRSPLKWQLYIPIVLSSILVLVLHYVRSAWRRRVLYAGIGLSFVLMNAFLLGDVYRKILVPRAVSTFSALQQTDLEHKNMLFISSTRCIAYQQNNPFVTTELNQVLTSKNVQVKRIALSNLDSVNLAAFDYVLDCQNSSNSLLSQRYGFALANRFADNNFQLYKNPDDQQYVTAKTQLFSLPHDDRIGAKHDFAQQILQQDFTFAESTQAPDNIPATELQDAFETISFKNIQEGTISTELQPAFTGQQTLFITDTSDTLYYLQEGNTIMLSATPQKGYIPALLLDGKSQITVRTEEGKALHFTYIDPAYQYKNLIPNASLEADNWQKDVSDCYAYEDTPQKIGMRLNPDEHTDGKQSLELESTSHIACTGPDDIAVQSEQDYLISFDYQSVGGSYAGYFIGFDDPDHTFIDGRIANANKDASWQTFTKGLTAPKGATHMRIMVYAFPDISGTKVGKARYDNFKLSAIPNVQDRFYLTHEPDQQLQPPAKISYQAQNPTKATVTISGATTPFYLTTKETYTSQWQLQAADKNARSWLPFGQGTRAGQHLKVNGSMNGWYVEPAKLCQRAGSACTKSANGGYDIRLVMEFMPQRWFYLGVLVSSGTFIGVAWYYIRDLRRDRNAREYRVWHR